MIRYGFYDNVTGGVENKYYASDVSKYLYGVFGNGYFPTIYNEFKALANNDLTITLQSGRWWIGGHWCESDEAIVYNITGQSPISSTLPRIDRIVMRHDNSPTGQSMAPVYKVGVASSNPEAPALIGTSENDEVYEMPICQIYIPAGATNISQDRITDERQKIGWIIDIGSNVVYDTIDATITTTTTQTIFTIPTDLGYKQNYDKLEMYVNGQRLNSNEWTLSGNIVTITAGVLAGNDVTFVVSKIVNGTGIDNDTVAKINDLTSDIAKIKKYNYYCTGSYDNINLSDMVQDILDDTTDPYGQYEILVHGTMGISSYYGSGTNTDPRVYFKFGKETTQNKKVVVNFANCARISINVDNTGVYSVLFGGYDVFIKNPYIICTGGGTVWGFNGQKIECEGANINISGTGEVYFGKDGTIYADYKKCRVSIVSTGYNAFGFIGTGGLMRVIDCEAYVYTGNTSYEGVAIYVQANQANNVLIAERNNLPIKTRASYTQTNVIKINSGFYSLVSNVCGLAPLLYTTGDGKSQIGTMIVSKA